MKIAHLTPQYYPYTGGAEICVHNVCRALAADRHEVSVITTTPPGDGKWEPGYNVIRLWSRTCGALRKAPFPAGFYLRNRLAAIQRKMKFDLWQVTMGWPLAPAAVDFFRSNKIPCLLRCCGEDIQTAPEISYGYRLNPKTDSAVRRKYPLFDGFVAITPSVREEYLKLGVPDTKIRIIPNGVDNARFRADREKRRAQKREELGIGPDETVIISVGRYHTKKGFDLIPETAKILLAKGCKFRWIIAGRNCGEVERKQPGCGKLGIKIIEKLGGPQSGADAFNLPPKDAVDLYLASDIFALPTIIETFGMAVIEGMAAGLPAASTDAPGVRDVVEHGVNGLRAPVMDVPAFAEITASLIQDKELRARLAKKALSEAENIYDWKIVTGKYLDFYRHTIALRSGV